MVALEPLVGVTVNQSGTPVICQEIFEVMVKDLLFPGIHPNVIVSGDTEKLTPS